MKRRDCIMIYRSFVGEITSPTLHIGDLLLIVIVRNIHSPDFERILNTMGRVA